MAATGAEFDFSSLDYGAIGWEDSTSTYAGYVDGDNVFGTAALPTMRNIGNTFFNLQVRQDDMGFGYTPGPNYKVYYDAKVGSISEYPFYGGQATATNYDPTWIAGDPAPAAGVGWTTLPGDIHCCNTWKLDFSIHIETAASGSYSGIMQLQPAYLLFNNPQVDHPGS